MFVKGLSTGPWRCEHSLFSFFWELREKKQRKTQSWGRETEKILQFSSYLLALGVPLPIMLCVFPCGGVQDQATLFFRNYYTAPLFSIYSFLWKSDFNNTSFQCWKDPGKSLGTNAPYFTLLFSFGGLNQLCVRLQSWDWSPGTLWNQLTVICTPPLWLSVTSCCNCL